MIETGSFIGYLLWIFLVCSAIEVVGSLIRLGGGGYPITKEITVTIEVLKIVFSFIVALSMSYLLLN